jgi:folylpolyglutamate synthase/dihydropteroate synthase
MGIGGIMDSTILIGIVTLITTVMIAFMAWLGTNMVSLIKEVGILAHRINNQQGTENANAESIEHIKDDIQSLKISVAVIEEKFSEWEKED